MKRKTVIFTDIGDTIINESSEVRKVQYGVVYDASCIPGAKETMLKLYEEGFQIIMVADGLVESFDNTMRINQLSHIFQSRVISEEFGKEKPDEIMFRTALERGGLTEEDKPRIVMVGNRTERDIIGANRFGIKSVLLTWSKRYDYTIKTDEMKPTFTISRPEELYDIIHQLEQDVSSGNS